MNKELETVKRQLDQPVIYRAFVTMGGSLENHWTYSDTDSSVDYFNMSRGSEKYLIESLLKDGSESVFIYTNGTFEEGSNEAIKLLKKIDRIAKRSHYTNNVKGFNEVVETFVCNGELIKKSGYIIEGTFNKA